MHDSTRITTHTQRRHRWRIRGRREAQAFRERGARARHLDRVVVLDTRVTVPLRFAALALAVVDRLASALFTHRDVASAAMVAPSQQVERARAHAALGLAAEAALGRQAHHRAVAQRRARRGSRRRERLGRRRRRRHGAVEARGRRAAAAGRVHAVCIGTTESLSLSLSLDTVWGEGAARMTDVPVAFFSAFCGFPFCFRSTLVPSTLMTALAAPLFL
ncbi:hypothetical protein FI667_g11410, partial [Globisporangium splendens]